MSDTPSTEAHAVYTDGHGNISADWPSLNTPSFYSQCPPQKGWLCPRCDRVNAPWLPTCSCSRQTASQSAAGDYPPSPGEHPDTRRGHVESD